MTLDDDSVFFRSFVLLSSPFSFKKKRRRETLVIWKYYRID